MKIKITAPRPTALIVDVWGTIVIALCSLILVLAGTARSDPADILPIGAAWIGALIARALDVLKDSPDDVPLLRLNIVVYAITAGLFLIALTLLFRQYPQIVVPTLTGFGALYGAIGSKIVNNENAIMDGFADASGSSSSGCRYPGGDS